MSAYFPGSCTFDIFTLYIIIILCVCATARPMFVQISRSLCDVLEKGCLYRSVPRRMYVCIIHTYVYICIHTYARTFIELKWFQICAFLGIINTFRIPNLSPRLLLCRMLIRQGRTLILFVKTYTHTYKVNGNLLSWRSVIYIYIFLVFIISAALKVNEVDPHMRPPLL